jgi:hypothetical protein
MAAAAAAFNFATATSGVAMGRPANVPKPQSGLRKILLAG